MADLQSPPVTGCTGDSRRERSRISGRCRKSEAGCPISKLLNAKITMTATLA
jgi:hypothetical protein